MRAKWNRMKEEAMFWRLMRQALYEDMAGPAPEKSPLPQRASPKLSPGDISHIQFRYAHGEYQKDLAREFGVTQVTISEHVKGVARLCGRGTGIRKISFMREAA